jgi:transglutaminase-like putative cysteine protease
VALFNIYHLTKYTYSATVRESANQLKLYAKQDQAQRVLDHRLDITHDPPVETYVDFWGNRSGIFTLTQPHDEMKIVSSLTVETFSIPLPEIDKESKHHWAQLVDYRQHTSYFDYLYLEKFNCYHDLLAVIDTLQWKNSLPVEVIRELNSWIYKEFNYIKGVTSIDTTLDEIWKLHAGVCQDFAHLLLAMLRMIHIPARYVSGYICPNKNGMRGEGATHAWVEAFLPFHGWVGIDPTNNCLVSDGHLRLAVGRNFADCSPVKGFFKGDADQLMEVAVSVSYDGNEKPEAAHENLEMQVAFQADRTFMSATRDQQQ